MAGSEIYDVVVVGGGAAGCVVAARLAEQTSASVALLEAGPDLRADVPGGLRDGWRIVPTSEIDWGYATEPDDEGQSTPLRRVKALGGTSWVTRYVVRGAPADYDDWASLENPGWGFTDLLPYLRRLESDLDFGDAEWHGSDGPLPVTRYPELELTDVASAALDAARAAGFAEVDDHNEPCALGVGRMPRSSRGGIRVTTADAYLPLGRTSANLMIRADTQVDTVTLAGDRATGVVLAEGSLIEAAHVVLCGGTYGSPAILLRSGIGPQDHLRAVGVPVAVNLPGVGSNLSDHGSVWAETGYAGPARQSPNLDLLATFHSSGEPSDQAPDLALWFADPSGDPPSFDIDVVLLRPRSRGSVRLRSRDPAAPLRIVLPGLAEPSDSLRLAEGLERAIEIASSSEVRRHCVKPPSPSPCSKQETLDFVRANAYSIPHVIGTCSMGPRPDEGAVVDATGAVHGLRGLTVADASVIPNAHSAFTHVVTIALSEKIAESVGSAL